MARLRSHRVLRPRLSRFPSIPLPKLCLLSHLRPPFLRPPPRRPPLLLLMPWAPPDLFLLPIHRAQGKPSWETVARPHSSPCQETTPNWFCTPTYTSQARSFSSLLRRSRVRQRSPRCSGTSAAHVEGAAWTLVSRPRRRPGATSDGVRA